jgi:Na+-translocating ferredoxin:NAD+ oxidoreductase subunit E
MGGLWKAFKINIIKNNAMFVVCLGQCPALILTTTMDGTIGMTIALAFCLMFTNMTISLMRNIIPNMVRIPIEVCIGATFVTIVDLFLHGTVPAVWALLGIYLPLITVN